MVIMKGTVLCYPYMAGSQLRFLLTVGSGEVTVVRKRLQEQKKDMVFLCPGQTVLLRGSWEEDCLVAEKIRILTGKGADRYGDHTAVSGADAGDPEI